jgi:hypothetical protein
LASERVSSRGTRWNAAEVTDLSSNLIDRKPTVSKNASESSKLVLTVVPFEAKLVNYVIKTLAFYLIFLAVGQTHLLTT